MAGADEKMRVAIEQMEKAELSELNVDWDDEESYYGDHIVSYDDKEASLYDLSQVYAIKNGLWEPGVKIDIRRDKNNLLRWIFTAYYGRMIDPLRLAEYDRGKEREEFIKQTRSWYDDELIDKPREVLSDADIIELFNSITYQHYLNSKNATVEIDEDNNNINIGDRNFPLDCIDEIWILSSRTSYGEIYNVEHYRKALYSSRWNGYYCDLKTNPHLAPEFNK